jgi:putative MFS transporter
MSSKEKVSLFTTVVILTAAAIAWMHDGYSLVIITLLNSELQTFFNVNDSAIGLVISLQFVFTVPGAILFGEIGDRFGRKKALIISIAWDAIFSSLTALVPSNMFFLFAILRMISGLGVSWGISFSIISEFFSPKRRGAAGGLIHSTFVFGYIAAIIVTLFIGQFGWQWCFLTALFPIPFLFLFWFALPESAIWSEYDKAMKETGKKQKLRITELFNAKWIKLTVALIVLFYLAETAYHALVDFAPLFFRYLFTYLGAPNPQSSSLIYMLILMLMGAIALFFFGFLSDYIGRKKAFALDNIIGVIGGLIFAISLKFVFNIPTIMVATILLTFGFGLHGIFGVWSSELYDTELRASANSIIFSIARGFGFGAFFVGLISDALNPYTTEVQQLAHPFVSLQALGTGMLLSLFAFVGVLIMVNFVPEPLDKEIRAMSKQRVLKP